MQKGEPHERNPCAPGFEEQPLEETSRQAGCTSKAAWNLAGKHASSKPKIISCEGARDTEDRTFIVDSGVSMHNAEQRRIKAQIQWIL